MRNDGYLWPDNIQEIALKKEKLRQEEEERIKEEKRKAQLAQEAAEQKQKEIDFVNEIKNRGKRQGMTTFVVNGAVFNMVPVRGNYDGTYQNCMISEVVITDALYNAVMYNKTPTMKDYEICKLLSLRGFNSFIEELNKLTKKKFRSPDRDEIRLANQGGQKKGKTGAQKPTSKINELGMLFPVDSEGYFWENWTMTAQRYKNSSGEYDTHIDADYRNGIHYCRIALDR